MQIGITSAICQKNHSDAIQFASDNGIEFLQIYLNLADLQKGDEYLLEISRLASMLKIKLTSHISEDLKGEDLDEIARKHSLVLWNQEKKIAVIHFDDNLKESVIEAFNKEGITVYIENYHRGISKKSELLNHDKFVEFVLENSERIGAVVDFPRYFSGEEIGSICNIEKMIIGDLEKFEKVGVSVLFHTIGKKSFESGRKSWTIPGGKEDLIPQESLIRGASTIFGSGIGLLILECEKIEHSIGGYENLKKISR
ncbi:MAG: hypothetical protein KAI67_00945 [Candidatus Pacebacteria bacterium]|nr:hypothetical protein [Candidatus Paceibacterota bacterium]